MGQPTLLSMGTRPEIIKMAPLYRALRAIGHDVSVLHSGQHGSMAWPLYKFFDMIPDPALELHRHGTFRAGIRIRAPRVAGVDLDGLIGRRLVGRGPVAATTSVNLRRAAQIPTLGGAT